MKTTMRGGGFLPLAKRGCCDVSGRRALRFEPLEQRRLLSASPYFLVKAADVQAGGGASPFEDVNLVRAVNGETYSNNYVTNDDTVASARSINVGAVLLNNYDQLGTIQQDEALYDGYQIVGVFVLEGARSSIMGSATNVFQPEQGRLGLFLLDTGVEFNKLDPSTWGATDSLGNLLEPLAVYDLKAGEDIVDPGNNVGAANTLTDPLGGGPGIFTTDYNPGSTDNQVNQTSLNTTTLQFSQGVFLFTENTTFEGTMIEGADFFDISALEDASGNLVPIGYQQTDEGLAVEVDQQFMTTPVTSGLDYTIMNAIAQQLGGLVDMVGTYGGLGNPLDVDNNAANGIQSFALNDGTGSAYEYLPGIPSTTVSDFQLLLDTETAVGTQFQPCPEISGYKWHDCDADGEWDENEPVLCGWDIVLTNEDGTTILNQTKTDANGQFTFNTLADGSCIEDGTYRVYEVVSSGWDQTYPDGPINPTADPYHTVVIVDGVSVVGDFETTESPNFGNALQGSICGYVWDDINNNGEWDYCEKGINCITVYLDLNNNGTRDIDVLNPENSEPYVVTTSVKKDSYGWGCGCEDACCPTPDYGCDDGCGTWCGDGYGWGDGCGWGSGHGWDHGWDHSWGDGWKDGCGWNDGCYPYYSKDGFYRFDGLSAGVEYVVRVELPTGATQTYPAGTDPIVTTVPAGHYVTLESGEKFCGDYKKTESPNFGLYGATDQTCVVYDTTDTEVTAAETTDTTTTDTGSTDTTVETTDTVDADTTVAPVTNDESEDEVEAIGDTTSDEEVAVVVDEEDVDEVPAVVTEEVDETSGDVADETEADVTTDVVVDVTTDLDTETEAVVDVTPKTDDEEGSGVLAEVTTETDSPTDDALALTEANGNTSFIVSPRFNRAAFADRVVDLSRFENARRAAAATNAVFAADGDSIESPALSMERLFGWLPLGGGGSMVRHWQAEEDLPGPISDEARASADEMAEELVNDGALTTVASRQIVESAVDRFFGAFGWLTAENDNDVTPDNSPSEEDDWFYEANEKLPEVRLMEAMKI